MLLLASQEPNPSMLSSKKIQNPMLEVMRTHLLHDPLDLEDAVD
eukprot:SAG11_NODE_3660_length_2303_cov_1.401089_1_plen_44_part_00